MKSYKRARNDLTQAYVRKLFDYNPRSGLLFWKIGKPGFSKGSQAGTTKRAQRVRVKINGKLYFAHRIIWLWVTGRWPKYEIDHRDVNAANNRWKNLRAGTSSQNLCKRGYQSNNTSGYKGVALKKHRGTWIAEIKAEKKRLRKGGFQSARAAFRARKQMAFKLHREWARH